MNEIPATARPLIVLLGPTAIGKSRIGLELATRMGTELLTADSCQVYRGMDIGMDKPRPEERGGIPHRLIDLVEPDEPFNVGQYRRLALREIARLHAEGRVPLMVGGTGLYIRAVVRGLWEGPPPDWKLRERFAAAAEAHGPDHLFEALTRVDPELARTLHPRDQAKIIRGLEAHALVGRPLSAIHREHRFAESPFRTLLIGLTMDRAALYRRVDARVEKELAKGLLDETRRLLAAGYRRSLGSMKGLGYRQLSGYLEGEYDFDEAVRRLKRDTRHFAKRQMTWFRKEPNVSWVTVGEDDAPADVAARAHQLADAFLKAPAAHECAMATHV